MAIRIVTTRQMQNMYEHVKLAYIDHHWPLYLYQNSSTFINIHQQRNLLGAQFFIHPSGAFIYEYGDHGGLVVMADDVRKTKLVRSRSVAAARTAKVPMARMVLIRDQWKISETMPVNLGICHDPLVRYIQTISRWSGWSSCYQTDPRRPEVVFSWNEGQSWYDFELSSMPVEVRSEMDSLDFGDHRF